MSRLAILAALALAGCDARQAGADGYVFKGCPQPRTVATISLDLHDSDTALRRAAALAGHPVTAREGDRHYLDFGTADMIAGRCHLNLIRPEVGDQRVNWGHGMTHCFCGQWHD